MEVKLTATFHRTITIQVDDEEEKTAIAAQIKLSCEVDGVDQITSFQDLRINGETAGDQGMNGLDQPKKFVTITEATTLAQQAFNAMQRGKGSHSERYRRVTSRGPGPLRVVKRHAKRPARGAYYIDELSNQVNQMQLVQKEGIRKESKSVRKDNGNGSGIGPGAGEEPTDRMDAIKMMVDEDHVSQEVAMAY